MGDRLGDEFWTDEECTAFNTEDITPAEPKWNDKPTEKMIALFALYKNDKFTNKVIILPTDDQMATLSALTTEWRETGLDVQLGGSGELTYGWEKKIAALKIVLERYNYKPKFDNVPGVGNIYRYESWLEGLI